MAKKPSFKLSDPVTYTVPETQVVSTRVGGQELVGSIHHRELVSFAGLVGRVHEETGAADIVIFPPGAAPKWLLGIDCGPAPGQFQLGTG